MTYLGLNLKTCVNLGPGFQVQMVDDISLQGKPDSWSKSTTGLV